MSVSFKLCSRARNHSFFIWQVSSLIRRSLKDPLIQGSMRQTLNIQLLCSWPHSGSMRRLRKPRPEAVSSFNNLISVCKFHRNGTASRLKAQGRLSCTEDSRIGNPKFGKSMKSLSFWRPHPEGPVVAKCTASVTQCAMPMRHHYSTDNR